MIVLKEAEPVRKTCGGVFIDVLAQPRASQNELAGVQGGALKVRLAAPPVDGEANAALARYLAKRLGVPSSAVTVVKGQTSRKKLVRVMGIELVEALRILGMT